MFIKKSYIMWVFKASYLKKKIHYQRDIIFIHRLAATLFGIFWLEQFSFEDERIEIQLPPCPAFSAATFAAV